MKRNHRDGPASELAVEGHQVRHRAGARAAPVSPEVEDHHLAAEVRQSDGLAGIEVGGVDLRRRLAGHPLLQRRLHPQGPRIERAVAAWDDQRSPRPCPGAWIPW